MVVRLEHLLLVCAVRFVVVIATISDWSLSYVHIIVKFYIGTTIHQFSMYELLKSVLGANPC